MEEGLLDTGLLPQPQVTIPPSHLGPYVDLVQLLLELRESILKETMKAPSRTLYPRHPMVSLSWKPPMHRAMGRARWQQKPMPLRNLSAKGTPWSGMTGPKNLHGWRTQIGSLPGPCADGEGQHQRTDNRGWDLGRANVASIPESRTPKPGTVGCLPGPCQEEPQWPCCFGGEEYHP